jgi:hypothetical protein
MLKKPIVRCITVTETVKLHICVLCDYLTSKSTNYIVGYQTCHLACEFIMPIAISTRKPFPAWMDVCIM